jgi:hypothetical protein
MDLDLEELFFAVGAEEYWGNDRVEMVDIVEQRKEGVGSWRNLFERVEGGRERAFGGR